MCRKRQLVGVHVPSFNFALYSAVRLLRYLQFYKIPIFLVM